MVFSIPIAPGKLSFLLPPAPSRNPAISLVHEWGEIKQMFTPVPLFRSASCPTLKAAGTKKLDPIVWIQSSMGFM